MTTLVFAPRSTETGRQLATAAHRRGLPVRTLHDWRAPADLIGTAVHLYAGPLFADAVAADLGLALLEAPEDWLAQLPVALTGRTIEATTLGDAWTLRRPAFVKPPNNKSFAAKVYRDGTQLPGPDAADADTTVLVSDIVEFTAEFRLFLLDGQVVASSRYAVRGDLAVAPLGDGEKTEILAFAADLPTVGLPSAIVVDVGTVAGGGWAVVEANAAWASGGYACDPDRVLDTVLRAAGPRAALRERDARHVRPAPAVVR
jgi:hypothetical protein